MPTYVQTLQFTVKEPTVGKAATFVKVDHVIRETKNLMNVINKVVTTCFDCANKVSYHPPNHRIQSSLSPHSSPQEHQLNTPHSTHFVFKRQATTKPTTKNNISIHLTRLTLGQHLRARASHIHTHTYTILSDGVFFDAIRTIKQPLSYGQINVIMINAFSCQSTTPFLVERRLGK